MPSRPLDETKEPLGFWLGVALLAMLAVLKPLLVDTFDPDAFWHLQVAREMLRSGVGPLIDQISFASIKTPWTPYSWLAELVMLAVWSSTGWRGALLLQVAMSAVFVVLLALCCREIQRVRRSEPVSGFTSLLATGAGVIWSLAYFSFRPATMAIVLLALAAWLILRDRRLNERSRAVWQCIPLAALLVNIHLTAILLPAWFGCLAAGAVWECRKGCDDPVEGHRRLKRYVLLGGLTALACLATPMLPGVIRVMAHYQAEDVMVASSFIGEMQPFYTSPFGKVSAALILLTIVCAIWNRRRLRMGEMLWFALMLVLLMRLGRFSPLTAIIAAPIAATVLPRLSDRPLQNRLIQAVLAILLCLGLWRCFTEFPIHTPLNAWMNRQVPPANGYPTEAADYVAANVAPRHGKLINEFNWGGYLAWRLGDRYQILMDGRTQLYTTEFWQATCLGDETSRRKFVESVQADAAILPLTKSVFAESLKSLGWTVTWQDKQSVVMLPP